MGCQADYTEEDLRLMQSVADEIFEELKKLGRYKQVEKKGLGFVFPYSDFLKLKKKFKFTDIRRKENK